MAARRKAAKARKSTARRSAAKAGASRKRRGSTRATGGRAKARRPAPPRRRAAGKAPAPRRAADRGRAEAAPSDVMALPAPNGRPALSDIGITHHHADYTSHDVEAVRRFYTETLGIRNAISPGNQYLTVFFSPRSSLGFMSPMPGAPPESWSPPGEPNIYLFVEDVDRAHRLLTERGVNFEMPPTDMPWGHRMAICRDPEGRRVCLAKDLRR